MSKNRKTDIRKLTVTAMMIALSIVFERLLPIVDTRELRLSLGNVPIALTSIAVSPVYGAVCGVVADLIGCFIKGYPPYPFLMLAPLVVGFLPYYGIKLFGKLACDRKYGIVSVSATMIVTNVIASLFITTMGLAEMYGTSFYAQLVLRFPTIIAGTVFDVAVIYLLVRSGVIIKILSNGGK